MGCKPLEYETYSQEMEALLLKNSTKCLIDEGDFNATVGDKSQRTLDDSLRPLRVESNERS